MAMDWGDEVGLPGHICHLWAQERVAVSLLGPHGILREISGEVM